MDIVFNIDNNYVRHACVTLISICESNKNCSITFHILSLSISEENKQYLKYLAERYHNSVFFYNIEENALQPFPIGRGTCNPKLTHATYLRLFIPSLLPISIKKVLFLDCDLVVNGTLEELWNMPLGNYYIASVDDNEPMCFTEKKRLGLRCKTNYFNAGVMLLNLEKLRDFDLKDKAIDICNKKRDLIFYHDQDIFNILLCEKRLVLEERWNKKTNIIKSEDIIIHFAGCIKPWHIESSHPLKYLYYQYLSRTKWAQLPPSHYFSLKQRFKNIIKLFINKIKHL